MRRCGRQRRASIEMPELRIQRYGNAFLRGDKPAMDREVALGRGKTGEEDWLSDQEALTLAYAGQLREARHKDTARDRGRATRILARAARHSLVRARRCGKACSATRSRRPQARSPHSNMSSGRDVRYGAGAALAFAGNSVDCRTLGTESGGGDSRRTR